MEKKIKRVLYEAILKSWRRGKSILLLGPRQTGKTTLTELFQFDLSINFLSAHLRQTYEQNPDLILKEVAALKKKEPALVLIDEVQKVPAIMDPIQYLIDKKQAQFFITGSSARKLKQQADLNLLPGRVISYRMDGFSLSEYSQNELGDILYFGSLPAVAMENDSDLKEDYLRTYVEVYLEEEIRKEAALRNMPAFYQFLQLSAEQAGQICSYSGISQDTGISHVTVKSYYEILESTLIASRVEPITVSTKRKKLIRSPKYLFFDMGVRRLCAKQGTGQSTSEKGLLFEQFVGLEILKKIRQEKKKWTLHFWTDPEVADVDWVIKSEKNYYPIEVKLNVNVSEKDCRHLKAFIQEYKCPHGGVIVYTGTRKLQLTGDIVAIPWIEFFTQIPFS